MKFDQSTRDGKCPGTRLCLLVIALGWACHGMPARAQEPNVPASAADSADRHGAFPDYREVLTYRRLRHTACGPLSLLAILRQMQIAVSEDDAQRIVAAAGNQGTNFDQLRQLAAQFGLYTAGVETTADRLQKLGLFAVAHLNLSRFVAVIGYSEAGFYVVEPLATPVLVSKTRFQELFTGRALLVSRKPLTQLFPDAGPATAPGQSAGVTALHLSQTSIGVGTIHSHDWHKSISLSNEGTSALEIKKVVSSCACMTGAVIPPVIPGGQSAVLMVQGTQEELGPFSRMLTLITDRKATPIITVPVQGYLEPPLFLDPPVVEWLHVLANQTARAEVSLRETREADLGRLQLETPSNAPITGEFRRSPDGLVCLSILWQGSPEPGWHRYRLAVSLGETCVKTPLYVAAHVVPPLEATPENLVLDEAELRGATWSRRVFLQVNTALSPEFHYRWTDFRFGDGIAVTQPQLREGRWVVELSPKPTGTAQDLLGLTSELILSFGAAEGRLRLYGGRQAFSRSMTPVGGAGKGSGGDATARL